VSWSYPLVPVPPVWVKTNQLQRLIRTGRTGHWINHSKEHCLVGVKGKPRVNKGVDCDVIVAEASEGGSSSSTHTSPLTQQLSTPGIHAIVEDMYAIVEGIYAIVEDMYAIVEGIYAIIEDIYAIVEGIYAIVEDMYAIVEGIYAIFEGIYAIFEGIICAIIEVENTSALHGVVLCTSG